MYLKGIAEHAKERFKKFLRKELRDRFGNNDHVNQETHVANLSALKDDIDQNFKNVLQNGEIYFGRVQKIVNLYLKYRWICFNEQKPVHCPVDSVVLNEINLPHIRWTKMTVNEYADAVRKIGVVNGFGKIAEWELEIFNRKNETYK